jgi:protein-S-isoprenylcysteine O-methyltransferase Ste14
VSGVLDRLAWLGPIAYFVALLVWGVLDFIGGDPWAVLYQVLTLAYLAAMALVYLLPGRARATARGGWPARLVALASANLLIPLSYLPQRDLLPYAVALAALFLANALSWWGLLTLRSAFSLTPEARHLVTDGPYRYVRHPLYLAGLLVGVVLLVSSWSALAAALFALYAAATLLRVRAEERLLARTFPAAWPSYARRTGMLLPRLAGLNPPPAPPSAARGEG